jgi:branched-subunit amino acid transport protein AzlD
VALTTEWIFSGLLVVGLAWIPFWGGSNALVAWGVNAVLFPGLAALYELSLILRGAPRPVAIQRVRLAAALLAAAVMWALVQNATWVPSGWQHPIWHLASDVLGRPVAGSISVDRSLTAVALLRLMTSASVFWLTLQLSRDPWRARFLIWSMVVIGAVYAAVGIFAVGFMPNGRVFASLPPTQGFKVVTSTFVNHSHYATFAGIGFISAVGLTLRHYRRRLSRTGHLLRLKIAALIDATGGQGAVLLGLGFVILTGLLLTASRGGIIATGLGFLALLALVARREKGSLRQEALLLFFAAVVVAAAIVGFSDVFVARVEANGLYEQGRLRAYIATIWSILAAPLLGFGYGTFSAAFPMFHDESVSMWYFWDKAHNTYLEAFQGLGLLFGTMLIASVVVLVWDCLKGARTRLRNATIPAIAVGVSVLVGTHALVDFSLQIQAVTLTYMAILGAGVAQARDDQSMGERAQRSPLQMAIRGRRSEDI